MTVYALFNELREKGIKLWHENGQLKFKAAKGSLTEDIRNKLVTNKSDIVIFLQKLSDKKNIPPIFPVIRSQFDLLPLSFAQERLWVIDQMNGDSTEYNVPAAVRINDELDINQVEETFNIIIARHDTLRTTFPDQDGYPQQLITESEKFKLEFIDYNHFKTKKIRERKAREYCDNEALRPFDLAKGPLIRSSIIRLSAQEYILVFNMHHIISDGWSIGVLVQEFGYIMNKLGKGETVDLPKLPIQYVDYSVWQRQWFEESDILKKQLDYWQEKLTGISANIEILTDYPRSSLNKLAGSTQVFTLDTQLCEQLKVLTKQQGCTFYMTLLAAFKVLLYRYTGQEDICLGGAIANRQYGETEGLIGMFVNMLALRDQLTRDDSFITVLGKVKTTCLQAYENQDVPFEKVVELVQPQRNIAVSPLFQILVVLQNAPMEELDDYILLDTGCSQFEMRVDFTETSEGLSGSIEYNTALYTQQTIKRLISCFTSLCQAIATSPDTRISALDYINQPEKNRLLTEFNQTQSDYPKDKCIHQLFVEQVKRNPEKTAIIFQNENISYQTLYDKSNDLALYLQKQGVKPGSLVGLCVERSLDMMVAMLGILQAGGAYVPLDPSYPTARLSYMLKDSKAKILITQERLLQSVGTFSTKSTKIITIDQQWLQISKKVEQLKSKGTELQQKVKPSDLAYVIYTSGSTGNPKGVMVEHGSVVNFLHTMADKPGITNEDKLLAVTTYCFDIAVLELYLPLIYGAQLCICATEDTKDGEQLQHIIEQYQPTIMQATPATWQVLFYSGWTNKEQLTILCGGEALSESLKNNFTETDSTAWNMFGPTETTIWSTIAPIVKDKSITIGFPIANTQIYILDNYNNPVPVGVAGELHIAGDGLARGYLNRSELTQEKFIDNPFEPETRMYKSGDLARWLDDGRIEYLGRIDTQVKIRGLGIEISKIESQLNKFPTITNSVVVAKGEETNKKLVAFYLTDETGSDLVIEELRGYLLYSLPEYMIPSTFVHLDSIPLTFNGKVDRLALNLIEVSFSKEKYLAPSNSIEQQLVDIWAQALKIDVNSISVNANFFELGGYSLLAVPLLAKINKKFDQSLPLSKFFTAPSIYALALFILSDNTCKLNTFVPMQIKGNE